MLTWCHSPPAACTRCGGRPPVPNCAIWTATSRTAGCGRWALLTHQARRIRSTAPAACRRWIEQLAARVDDGSIG
ncbi:hypothetical protein J7W19_32520 [Streptomyces mobaraensis NBRC 13819 = DSM 40847]|uniref:hypothetical protein n=1 Tax=Streptomyces mobaraensis TaxID=35621 RepID=UPI001B300C4D|nr:hypothetical protein [Streptomyces mobaraensis]QTT72031.1 hypothetical protein J7W19_00030 [Streptomyces mobaraensis NBRC 13819 = DSM 40847]QTT77468.1 hypothetical protein J7W19_32520 [Streptomyces mobaraensis NBRC 13819 = DSM 40847]